jgi:hypothetical protein
MELVKQNLTNLLSGLSLTMKKTLVMSAATSVTFLFYKLFLKKKSRFRSLGNGQEVNASRIYGQKGLELMKKEMRLRRSNISQMSSRIDNKRRKLHMFNAVINNLERGQKKVQNKTDQVFFNIMKKFSVFVVRNKFAFA